MSLENFHDQDTLTWPFRRPTSGYPAKRLSSSSQAATEPTATPTRVRLTCEPAQPQLRQGYTLRHSRRRDPRAFDYGTYILIEPTRDICVGGPGMDLEDVARWANTDEGEEL